MNKYYTPDIEEFHVGFEYEYNTMSECGSNTKYVKDIFKSTDNVNSLFEDLPNDWYDLPRVKYLDKEDIESLGFEIQIYNEVSIYAKTKEIKFPYIIQNFGPIENNLYDILYNSEFGNIIIFRGEIKNKSELKKLLKQLNINE